MIANALITLFGGATIGALAFCLLYTLHRLNADNYMGDDK